MTRDEYEEKANFLSLHDWKNTSPESMTDEELSVFISIEPSAHIVGERYEDGNKLAMKFYEEAGKRLVKFSELKKDLEKAEKECESYKSGYLDALERIRSISEKVKKVEEHLDEYHEKCKSAIDKCENNVKKMIKGFERK